jgi:hypothetical protein
MSVERQNPQRKIHLLCLWGLGDLFPTLSAIKKLSRENQNENAFRILSKQSTPLVNQLLEVFEITSVDSHAEISSNLCLLKTLLQLSLKKERMILMAPFGKAGALLRLLKVINPNIRLSDNTGNIYLDCYNSLRDALAS